MELSRQVKWLKAPVFLLCLAPLASLVWKAFHDGLGANPPEYVRNSTGTWTLAFLCITLGVTPARRLLRAHWLIRFRRMAGLFAFFYGSLHFVTYFLFDTGIGLQQVVEDVSQRPFITVGFTSFVLMVPLAITSTARMVRRLGGRRWQALHRLIYVSAIAGVVHYYWLVKSDVTVPLRFAVVVGVLLTYRLTHHILEKRQRSSAQVRPPRQSPLSPDRKS
jgi:methionine sulfoxide reductase heme-binding subunit